MKNQERHLSYYDKGYITSCKITSTNIPIEDNTEFDIGVKNRLNTSIRSDLNIDTNVASTNEYSIDTFILIHIDLIYV